MIDSPTAPRDGAKGSHSEDNTQPVDVPDGGDGTAAHPTTVEQVRQGHKGDHVRYILIISTIIAGLLLLGLAFGWIL